MTAAQRILGPAVPVLLAGGCLGLALATSRSHHGLADLLALALLYGLFALALQAASDAARALHEVLGFAVSLGIGTLLAWHCREQLQAPGSLPWLVGLAVSLGAGHYLLSRAFRPLSAGSAGRHALRIVVPVLLFAAVLLVAWTRSEVFRWHLLRHHKLFGTPAYYALARPTEEVEADLRQRHAASGAPLVRPQPPIAVAAVARPPDIVFVLVDTLRADALAAYAADAGDMPRLDAFAEQSLVFTDVQANTSWTRPSVASFFTGVLQEHHGAVDRGDRLPESAETLAERLDAQGFETAAFVTNYAAVGRDAGFAQGFDTFEELQAPPLPYARAEQVNGTVVGWLRSRRVRGATQPLFLYVHYLDPHSPYLSGGSSSPAHAQAYEAYRHELRYLDGHLAQLLDEIDALLPDARVLVTSDHGEEFGEHGERGHGRSLYREVIHLPTVLHVPGVEPARLTARLEQRDLFDLLLRLASGRPLDVGRWGSERARRVRYASLYTGTDSGMHRPYLQRVVMRSREEGDAKLIWSGYGSTTELYDLATDPAELDSLVRRRPEDVERLRAALDGQVSGWAPRVPLDYSDDTVDLLRALGYVE